jgi:hypothetical protein
LIVFLIAGLAVDRGHDEHVGIERDCVVGAVVGTAKLELQLVVGREGYLYHVGFVHGVPEHLRITHLALSCGVKLKPRVAGRGQDSKARREQQLKKDLSHL